MNTGACLEVVCWALVLLIGLMELLVSAWDKGSQLHGAVGILQGSLLVNPRDQGTRQTRTCVCVKLRAFISEDEVRLREG